MKRKTFIKTTVLGNAGVILAPANLLGTEWNGANGSVKKIKIGQIGISHEHASKITSLKKLPELFEIVGVVDDRNSTAARFAGNNLEPFKGIKWMTEEELFRTPGLQAVTVETANTDLVPTAMRCMEHNLAMHMDKPGGEDLELFGKLLNGCKEKNLPFQMGYMFRNNPAMLFCQKAVRKGWLGDIFEVHADMSHDYGGEDYQRYLSNFKGGIMFNLGCHHIDIIVSILGRPEKVTPFLKSTPGAVNGAKNNCLAILEYPHSIVSISACGLKPEGLKSRRFKISGSKGTIEFSPLERFDGEPLQMELILLEGNEEYTAGSHIVDFAVKYDRYEAQFIELAKIIRGEMVNPYTYEHDYLTQEVHMAASGYLKWRN
ncbi:Gfo/Idh/MocA family oxidoreductase [Arenibacter algicola]|uniref:Gfo/Idh/MocA family protein n=1 Tax=Arenibacter algicola TaxID=616991 RepID=UPI001C078215|nr:Gfo/Idh/MocA family oxidoreductase [Arenibacter algicola]MBU2904081.1 Gfo/Idh/MocA family oxidoreductase [Arenibacter algicola]